MVDWFRKKKPKKKKAKYVYEPPPKAKSGIEYKGNRYVLYDTYLTKGAANDDRKRLRKEGVRGTIRKIASGYALYTKVEKKKWL